MTTPPAIVALKLGIEKMKWMEQRIEQLRSMAMDKGYTFTKHDSDELDALYEKSARVCLACEKNNLTEIAKEASNLLAAYEATVSDTMSNVFTFHVLIHRPTIDWFGEGDPTC